MKCCYTTKTSLLIIFLIFSTNNKLYSTESLPSVYSTYYNNVPVLVTGGCGFIGSHLVSTLVSLGAQVTILDDLSTGDKNNISPIMDNVKYIHGTITDFNTCLVATKNQQIIFHLAAFISVPASVKDPYWCHNINVKGTENVFEAARINNVKRIVFSSSCAVYGESTAVCNEEMSPAPTSPYGFSKLIGEIYCKEYADVFDIETVAMRYFNVYGDRQDPSRHYAAVVAKFSHNMENNLPITIFGDGMQTRDFVPVETVVNANVLLGICNKDMIQGEVFNVATGKSITIFELLELLKNKYPLYTNTIIMMPARPGDVKHIAADCSKYNNLYQQLFNNPL